MVAELFSEGFDFPVSGPYQEFPILRSFNNNPYTGGSPGADRIIFNTNCQLAGVVTRKALLQMMFTLLIV